MIVNQPRLSQISIWKNHKEGIVWVIREALLLLREQPDLPKDEDSPMCHSLNRELSFCFGRACHRLRLPHHKPSREAKNQPYIGDSEPTNRESKIPDFQWVFVDVLAAEDSCERTFTLECKRLGMPSSRSWNLNENYVFNGICRFVTEPHEYGKGSDDCAMIGYIQSMEFTDILEEVNQTARQCRITEISPPPGGWIKDSISELEQTLERSFPVSPFLLRHFWVDIRKE
ncbi:MAG: hypothetical protein JXA33_04090 [Anaerolineae bacterium]|nr:hypothetical protein [Anaerolineae bacterium]